MTRKQTFGVVRAITAVMLVVVGIFTVTFFLTAFVYGRIGQQPSGFLAYIINIVVGLFFCFVILYSLGTYFGSKRRTGEMGAFGPIFEAMQKIAKGDFSVRLDNNFGDNLLMSTLTTSVNNMALELDQMEQMRQEFVSNVSHDLQSPLTSIRGFAKALQNDYLSADERSHYLAIIETESMRLSKLTDNLLKLASLEAQHAKFEPKPYDLDKQLRTLILACEPQWTGKALDMAVSLEEVMITADQDLMSQVWINLISNSIKFTPEHGEIRIDLRRHNGAIEFKIGDTGIGISDADQAHIFERFYKADKSRTHSNNGGSGLGLSIVHKIVGMHGGTIAVKSKPDAGTTFIISLPISQKIIPPV